ncbi:TIGR03118 family protein [Kribbella sp. NPDC004875]|uniref:TIGR03118 family protein n=1 Tax=Kribbella sp. NPDC004875 TaxID=3364107 RepID=UPI0036B470EF
MSVRSKRRPVAVATALVGGLALLAPAVPASAHRAHQLAVRQVNLVSDQKGKAAFQDPDLVNPWGLALGATTPLWSANNHSSTATVYSVPAGSRMVTKLPIRVTVNSPTGQVNNSGPGFVLRNKKTSAPANFIFATEEGKIAAWSRVVDSPTGPAEIKASTRGAVYKGLAIASTKRAGDRLYAANFSQHRIDVFNSRFDRVRTPKWAFRDDHLPKSFGPFNVQALKGRIFVTYAQVDPKTNDEVAGPGRGFVDEYTVDGRLITRVASHGTLNAPWGLALAPRAWGQPRGTLLVGNFGDGRISIYHPRSLGHFAFAGLVRDTHGKPLTIDGLWALLQGTATTGGTDALWFSSGPNDENHGLIGVLRMP